MKLLIISLLLISSALAGSNYKAGRSPQLRQHSLTAFLKKTLLNLRNEDSTLLESILVDDLSVSNNESSLTYSLNMSSIEFQNAASYSVSNVATDLDEGSIELELIVVDLAIAGNYSLDGMVSSVIALKGEGRVNMSSHSVAIVGRGEIEVDNSTETTSIKNLRLVSIGTTVNVKFEGIQGEEIIGEIIKEDLEQIGNDLFDKASEHLNSALISIITQYLNLAFQEMPLETILRTKVLDTIGDGDLTGWYVSDLDCEYSESKVNFTCNGRSVVHDEKGSSGFWMSCLPEVGAMCTFSHGPNEILHQIQIEGWFSEGSQAMIEIYYEDAPSTAVEVFDETGIIELDHTRMINLITLYPNDPPSSGFGPLYTVVDRVLLVTSPMG